MAALLVAMSVMAVALSVALPVWNTAARREREAELVFRGEQYARAIGLFQRKYANTLPPNLDILLNERFLRKKYTDPITGSEFQLLSGSTSQAAPASGRAGAPGTAGAGAGPGRSTGGGGFSLSASAGQGSTTNNPAAAGGIVGVTSKSTEKSLRLYNGRGAYNEWVFVAVQRNTQAGGPGNATPIGASGRGTAPPGTANPGGTRGRGAPPPDGGRRGTGGLTPPPFGGMRRGGQGF